MAVNGLPPLFAEASGRVWSFAGREFDESRLELRVNGTLVELELKPLEVLLQLLQHAGEVVSKDDLLDAVWPGLTVVDGSLSTAVYKLRKALGDEDSKIVVNVPRVGYRLAAAAQVRTPRPAPLPTPAQWTFQAGHPVPRREQWCLVRCLDRSTNSEVWLAEHPKTGELRVFKFVVDVSRLKALKREVTVFRFLRESLGESREFVRIFEWNFDGAPYFLESEYGGPNLAEWAESEGGLTNIPLPRRLAWMTQIASAVAVAHAAGVLHKDLKPSNVLVTQTAAGQEQIKLADFGSASLLEPSRLKALGITGLGMTQTGLPASPSLTGTLMYLAPEVLAGNSPTAASDVYALGVMLYQLVAGSFRKPLAPGWEEQVEDPLLREDIAAAVSGDPGRRLSSPQQLVERLETLERRRAERNRLEQEKERALILERKRAKARARRPWIVIACLAAMAVAGSVYFLRKPPAQPAPSKTVAVLPFQNAGTDRDLDFLSVSLADEVATTLSYARGLSIRPFSAADERSETRSDLQRLGREMKVADLITGHFLKEGDQLQLTLEAIDVANNRVAWTDTFNVPAGHMIELREKLVARTQGALAAALGASALSGDAGTRPASEEAYDLYLRGAAMPADGTLNKSAIALLERSVGLDPVYAPAWFNLSQRYYSEGRYENGGREMIERYRAAVERAVALDPNYIPAAAFLANDSVERGDLIKAWHEAEEFLQRRPDSVEAHTTRAYVFRYAGLLEESERECEVSLTIDPQKTPRFCSISNFQNRHYKHAMDFVYIGGHTDWARAMAISILLRAGRQKDALQIQAPHIPQWVSFEMLPACAEHKPAPEIAALAVNVNTSEDPEANYLAAANLAYCGQTKEALRFLRLAIDGNYCSYPAMDSDPFFASVRGKPEFAALRQAGIACRQKFQTAFQNTQQQVH